MIRPIKKQNTTKYIICPADIAHCTFNIGHKRRLGLIGAKRTTITVHRSEEVLPIDAPRHLQRQGQSSVSSEGEPIVAPVEPEFGPVDPTVHTLPEGERWDWLHRGDTCVTFSGICLIDGHGLHTVTLLSLIKTKHAHLEVTTENPPYYRPGWWDHASLAPSTTTLVFSRKWGQYVWESKDRGNDEGNILELCSTAIFHYYLLLYIVHIYYSKPIVTTITTTICVLLVILYYIYSLVLALYIDLNVQYIVQLVWPTL